MSQPTIPLVNDDGVIDEVALRNLERIRGVKAKLIIAFVKLVQKGQELNEELTLDVNTASWLNNLYRTTLKKPDGEFEEEDVEGILKLRSNLRKRMFRLLTGTEGMAEPTQEWERKGIVGGLKERFGEAVDESHARFNDAVEEFDIAFTTNVRNGKRLLAASFSSAAAIARQKSGEFATGAKAAVRDAATRARSMSTGSTAGGLKTGAGKVLGGAKSAVGAVGNAAERARAASRERLGGLGDSARGFGASARERLGSMSSQASERTKSLRERAGSKAGELYQSGRNAVDKRTPQSVKNAAAKAGNRASGVYQSGREAAGGVYKSVTTTSLKDVQKGAKDLASRVRTASGQFAEDVKGRARGLSRSRAESTASGEEGQGRARSVSQSLRDRAGSISAKASQRFEQAKQYVPSAPSQVRGVIAKAGERAQVFAKGAKEAVRGTLSRGGQSEAKPNPNAQQQQGDDEYGTFAQRREELGRRLSNASDGGRGRSPSPSPESSGAGHPPPPPPPHTKPTNWKGKPNG